MFSGDTSDCQTCAGVVVAAVASGVVGVDGGEVGLEEAVDRRHSKLKEWETSTVTLES
jgi:hypothetical protein